MIGDRISVQSSLIYETQDEVLAIYRPRLNSDGTFMMSHDGSVILEKAGGVKAKSTGTVNGDSIKVHKSQLLHLQNETTSFGGTNDFVSVIPIWFDHYQQLGWVPSDHVRIVGGGKL